jgi:hypothetical protein
MAIKTGLPMAAAMGTEAALVSMGVDPMTASVMAMGAKEGTKYGLSRAGYGLYAGKGGTLTAGMEDLKRQTMGNHQMGRYDANVIKDMIRGKKGQMIVGRGAFISSSQGIHPAMQSQPYGENYAMQNQLPPQYQKLHNGTIVEGRGMYA